MWIFLGFGLNPEYSINQGKLWIIKTMRSFLKQSNIYPRLESTKKNFLRIVTLLAENHCFYCLKNCSNGPRDRYSCFFHLAFRYKLSQWFYRKIVFLHDLFHTLKKCAHICGLTAKQHLCWSNGPEFAVTVPRTVTAPFQDFCRVL